MGVATIQTAGGVVAVNAAEGMLDVEQQEQSEDGILTPFGL